jgi:hypothetical protein
MRLHSQSVYGTLNHVALPRRALTLWSSATGTFPKVTIEQEIGSKRELVMSVMQGFVETIHLFKTRPDIVVPLLQRYLKIEDRKAVDDLHAFHVPLFQKVPRPSFPGMQKMRDFLVKKYPAAASLKEADIADSSFIDELEHSGFIDRLYVPDRK